MVVSSKATQRSVGILFIVFAFTMLVLHKVKISISMNLISIFFLSNSFNYEFIKSFIVFFDEISNFIRFFLLKPHLKMLSYCRCRKSISGNNIDRCNFNCS